MTTLARRLGKGKLLTVVESLIGEDESEDPVCIVIIFGEEVGLVSEVL